MGEEITINYSDMVSPAKRQAVTITIEREDIRDGIKTTISFVEENDSHKRVMTPNEGMQFLSFLSSLLK